MKKFLCGVLMVSVLSGACALHTPPVLTPTVATAITNGLTALQTILQQRNVSPVILAAITDAQTALAGDISGKTWGQIVRDLLTNLYSQIPPATQSDPVVWGLLVALEVALATIGA